MAPRRGHFVVYGWPDVEGNSVEVVRWILTQRTERVIWIVTSLRRQEALRVLHLQDDVRLTVTGKKAGLWPFLTASVVFVTHGLYLNPPLTRRKAVVNLWHGEGPKSRSQARLDIPLPPSTALVAGTRVFSEVKRERFELRHDQMIYCGLPRWDQLLRPAGDDDLRALGVDPTRPFILYMPTFRVAKAVGGQTGWTDLDVDLADVVMRGLVRGAAETRAQVVVKPHPYDAREYAAEDVLTVTNEDLNSTHLLMYRLLARAGGLVTDYSSVWTDFLTLDRPIGFALGDFEEYSTQRGLNVDNFLELVPGPVLLTEDDCAEFVRATVLDPAHGVALRARSRERIGLVSTDGATKGLFEGLAERGIC